jgi:hypothetical protein
VGVHTEQNLDWDLARFEQVLALGVRIEEGRDIGLQRQQTGDASLPLEFVAAREKGADRKDEPA